MIISILDKTSGFFSMFFFTINHYIYCIKNNINFKLDTSNWLFKFEKGWEDYFESIDIKYNIESNLDTNENIDYKQCDTILENYSIQEYKNVINKIYRYNEKIIDEINKIKEKLNLIENNYDSIFIRRGDKLIKESFYINAEEYLKILLEKNPECSKIFIQTDDYNCFLEIENYIKINNLNIELLTLCQKDTKGFVIFNFNLMDINNLNIQNQINNDYIKLNHEIKTSKSVNEMNQDEIYKHTIDMIIGIDIVLNSNICVTDFQSNISRFIKLAHKKPENIYDIQNLNNQINYNTNICPSISFYKTCIHKYLTKCNTNPQPPGIADFLRGTQTLFLLAQKYNYRLLIDYNIHPIFKYLKYNSNFYYDNNNNNSNYDINYNNSYNKSNTIELLPPLQYDLIYTTLENLFNDNNNHNLHILTNSFYNSHGASGNYNNNEIENSKIFLKNILLPGTFLDNLYQNKLNEFNIINNEKFIIIHLRFNDNCFFNKDFDILETQFKNIIDIIQKIIDDNLIVNQKIIIISNFYILIQKLKNIFKQIYFTNSSPIHLGSLSLEDNEQSIQETLLDLLFLINSSKIYGISQYGGTGFSNFISDIYDIEYINYSNLL